MLFFPGPNSFTGQDCLEFQVHGSKAVVAKLFSVLSSFPKTRAAEPGEFTRLAMEAGKIDLVEVEGLADLLAAETEMQRRLALEQSQGHLSALYQGWMDRITHARAMIEAELDFADEEDIPGSVSDRIWDDIALLIREIEDHLKLGKVGEIIRDGLKVVLIGKPNAGKSSLMNRLAGRDVAIVTAIPGTTRDVLSVDLDLEGFAVTVVDTAGLRVTEDEIEQEGIRRALLAAERADVVIALHPVNEAWEEPPLRISRTLLRVGSKSDIDSDLGEPVYDVKISTVTEEGIDTLLALLIKDLKMVQESNSLAIPTRIRHVSLLQETCAALHMAVSETNAELALRAESLRLAAHRLGRITGQVDTEGLLDIIFSSFCIGK